MCVFCFNQKTAYEMCISDWSSDVCSSDLATEVCVFRELVPNVRDVTTALLLDGSASLGASGGRSFRLELQCADALCAAMSLARERHGLFVFNGKTRHRVDVTCLKDFQDRKSAVPSDFGLATGGYTRLGADRKSTRLNSSH